MMPSTQSTKASQRTPWRAVVLFVLSIFGGSMIFHNGKQPGGTTARFVRSETKPPGVMNVSSRTTTKQRPLDTKSDAMETGENWRGAPVGDGEDNIDSYHSYDHRPEGTDPRDKLLAQYTIHPCPNNGIGTMVSGQDQRYFEVPAEEKHNYKERNPKFLCDVAKLTEDPTFPCVVYSFGSFDEISFEVGLHKLTGDECEVHTFDPAKLPTAETAKRNHFTVHDLAIGDRDFGKTKKVSTIMAELGHSHIHVLKIDVEGHERESLPVLVNEGTLDHVDQLSIEFHSVPLMKQGLDILVPAGFGIVYARREDRCQTCTEVSMVKMKR